MVNKTYNDLRQSSIDKLDTAEFDNAEFEVSELLAYVLGTDSRSVDFREKLSEPVDKDVLEHFEALVSKRIGGEPLQYIIGEWEFYGLPFKVGEGVLIPRQDTETVVDVAIRKLHTEKDLVVTDLCSGSGCIGIALDKNLSCKRVVCVEKSDRAVAFLEQNIKLNNSKAEILHGDIFDDDIIDSLPQSDLIVCNPPYLTQDDMQSLQLEVTHEPEDALYGGDDGLDYYREITRLYKDKLCDGGMLLFEIGIDQEDEVMKILIQHGFINVRTKKDLAGIYRCVYGYKKDRAKIYTDSIIF